MSKLFVCSDIHSFYTPLKVALDEAGFDPSNEDHYLIVCGDCFDRGDESEELLHYLMSLDRKILVKGNHDLLLEECCKRGYPYSYDWSNGTAKTINDIGGAGNGYPFSKCCELTYMKTEAYRGLLVNYFETKKYIFVHSWIPTNVKFEHGTGKPWYQEGKTLTWMEDWRNANDVEWEEAMWGNPFKRWKEGLNKTGKTIVFGHWHCSTGHVMLSLLKSKGNPSEHLISEFDEDAIWDPFIHDNVIGLDRCTSHTGKVNVLVLEDAFLESN